MENNSRNCYTSISEVCRTCLQQISDNSTCVYLNTTSSTSELTTILYKLKDFLPEVNLTLTPNAVLCCNCAAAIEFVYKFKKRCLLTEKYISTYIRETVNSVDLSQIIQNHNRHVIDLDKVNTTEYLTIIEDTDIKVPDLKYFESFTENEPALNSYPSPSINDVDEEDDIMECIYDIDAVPLEGFSTEQPSCSLNNKDNIVDDLSNRDTVRTETSSTEQTSSSWAIEENMVNDLSDSDTVVTEALCNEQTFCSLKNNEANIVNGLTEHMRAAQHNIRHRCTVCHFGTKYKSSIMLHMINHASKKPYKCGDCNHQSSHMGHLRRHFKSHGGYNNLHKCSECDFGSKYRSSLKVHMMNHTLERLSKDLKENFYKCSECDYKCNRKLKLKEHVKVHKKTKKSRIFTM